MARIFAYLPSFISQILDFIYWPVLIFILKYFELRDTEIQQFMTVAAGTVALNISYEGPLLTVLLIMMKK